MYLKPALASQGVKGSVTNALAAAFVGSLGGGKSFSNNMIVYYCVLFGAQALIVDPKAERGRWKETLPEIAHEINIVNLTSEEQRTFPRHGWKFPLKRSGCQLPVIRNPLGSP